MLDHEPLKEHRESGSSRHQSVTGTLQHIASFFLSGELRLSEETLPSANRRNAHKAFANQHLQERPPPVPMQTKATWPGGEP
jgi:hypothetical protein